VRADAVRRESSPRAWLLHFVYDLLWVLCAVLSFPWWATRCLTNRTFRRLVWERLGFELKGMQAKGAAPRVLVHGVSVGEVKAAQPLVAGLEERGYEVVLSATTDTGVAVAAQLYGAERVARFPLDFSLVVRRFLRAVKPDAVVLVELEVWPSFLLAANHQHLPVAVVNGRITERSFERYEAFRYLLPQFHRISMFCVQDEEYAARFRALSSEERRIVVTGNIKVDALPRELRAPGEELRRLICGEGTRRVVVAGSTHEPEERWIVEAWEEHFPDAALVLCPRHPERCEELAKALGDGVQRLTELRAGAGERDEACVLLVDTVGDLEKTYALADVVVVGGTLVEHGGQNMMEPAAAGCAVIHGPSVENFVQEARLLERAGASRVISGREELGAAVAALLADDDARAEMGERGRAAIEGGRGATRATLEALEALLPKAGSTGMARG
jgi:3-deoxy-D-manno-octulosonic-acid transferase